MSFTLDSPEVNSSTSRVPSVPIAPIRPLMMDVPTLIQSISPSDASRLSPRFSRLSIMPGRLFPSPLRPFDSQVSTLSAMSPALSSMASKDALMSTPLNRPIMTFFALSFRLFMLWPKELAILS